MTSKSIKKSVAYDLGRIFLGDGIIVSDGEQWKIQRKLLNPAFHYNILEKYVTIFNAQSDRMMNIFENEITKDSTETLKHLIEYALSTAYETSIGTSFEDVKDKMPFYIESSIKNISVMYDRFCSPLYHFDFFYKFSKNYRTEKQVRRNINELIDTVVRQRKESFSHGSIGECEEFENKSRPQLLDLLLQYESNNYFYTQKLLRDEIHTVIIAATDTTSTGLAYTMQLLADHPEVQEKAFREVQQIYLQQSQYATTISDLSKMVYLHAVIQETMRLYPPVPYLTKLLTEDVEYDDMILKKGLTIIVVNCELHRNPKYFVEPHKFMPERFLTERNDDSHAYSYIPFSAGPRSCIVVTNSDMEKEKIVPDVIDKAPAEILDVTYSDNVQVNRGNELTPTKVKDIPSVKWNAEEGGYYVLVMTDPDAPSRTNPKFREWHHWLVVNIPGNNVEEGETLSEYVGAGPPKGSGLHRYVLLVYKQPGKLSFTETKLTNKSGDGRGNFSIRNFAKKYQLENPIAGNFFHAQWDTYVPTLYKQLGS
ncbi:cytochrome p450 family 4 [Holotrichia oblita]|uniref:Cytochrome p450 family 4 n=1 Tax=Holotrichia oblita TaxID=644536 RepID=A0ACB9TEU3_HOLOL|nr:cytochrome p450 family 4 [Holotrichia oblita]